MSGSEPANLQKSLRPHFTNWSGRVSAHVFCCWQASHLWLSFVVLQAIQGFVWQEELSKENVGSETIHLWWWYRRMPYSRAFNSNPFPPKLYNTLRYSEQVIVNTSDSLNGCGSYLFQANNLYDPNYTGTGHQPLYYDQLTGIYNHWTVISSKMTIRVQRVSNPVQVQCVLLLDDDATLGTTNNINLLTERSGAVFGAADPGNGLLLTLSKTWSARKWFGANPLDNDNLQGTVSAGPSEGVYYGFMVQDLTGTSQSVACHVTMEFNVIWDELASVASS